MNVIEAIGLTKQFGSKTVVSDVSLNVQTGEIYGFLGRNGAGKSTFINMITGIIKPTSGEFKLLGETKLENVYSRIGVLPDYSTFYDSLTALGHIKYFAKINGNKITTAQGKEMLERVGLSEHANVKAGKFSFGMKKKLGIAQAIAHDPDLVFLDEPTSGVDAESGLSIQQLILDLKNEGKTIFMTSHNLNEVEKICTRMAIMKDGKIINEGTLEDLRAHYSASIQVEIKHSSLENGNRHLINQYLETVCREIETEGNITSMVIESEKKIPQIVRAFTKQNIDLYRINVDEPSLEEIFLQDQTGSSVSSF
jgi:ABC-2 type transport system ATP-binding protein